MSDSGSPSSLSCPGCGAEASLLLSCGHRLCQACVEVCGRELGQDGPACTECVGRQLLEGVLKGLLDALFEGQPRRDMETEETDGDQCRRHRRRLSRFCLEDEELICEQCESEEHQEHESSCVEEATQQCKRELREALQPLQEKLESLNTAKQTCQETTEHIRRQAQNMARLVKENFEKLHQFLQEEEISVLRALSEEEEQKSQKMKEKMDRLTDEILTLTEAISSTEEAMNADEFTFLKNYKKTSERTDCSVQDPVESSESLIDVAKHIGSLRFRVWEKMQSAVTYTPVLLDPNTADVCVNVSDELTTLRYSEEEQTAPDNPERFCFYECVLGSEGFTAGRHRWDVEVADCSGWALGVVKESVERKEWVPPGPERGLWCVGLSGGVYRPQTPTAGPLQLKRRPQKVSVQLDYEAGRVMFSDASDNSLIYKYKTKFTERIFPYFSNTCKRHPIRVLPEKVSVYTE